MAFLWLARWAPYSPLRGGDVEYSRGLIHALAQRGPIRVLGFEASGVVPSQRSGVDWTLLPHKLPNPALSVVSTLPNIAFKYRSAAFEAKAIEMASQGDVEAVFVDFIAMAWLVEPLKRALARAGVSTPVIMVNHNVEGAMRRQAVGGERSVLKRAVLSVDAAKAARLERAANVASDGLTAITDADRLVLVGQSAVPGLVASPIYEGPVTPTRVIDGAIPRGACVIGNHVSHHKRLVLRMALEALASQGAGRDIQIDISGAGDHSAFERDFPAFKYPGFIEDLEDYFSNIRLGILPDEIGGGFKLRVLMHSFMRVPMLAVHEAVRGMGLTDGVHYVGANSLEEMAAEVPRLIDDFDRLNAIQNAAFDHCVARYSGAERGQELVDFAGRLV